MDIKNTLENFLDSDGRLIEFPARRKMKLYSLKYLSERLTAESYTEKQLNEELNLWHTFSDPATLRRELCSYGFLDRERDCSEYRVLKTAPTIEYLLSEYCK